MLTLEHSGERFKEFRKTYGNEILALGETVVVVDYAEMKEDIEDWRKGQILLDWPESFSKKDYATQKEFLRAVWDYFSDSPIGGFYGTAMSETEYRALLYLQEKEEKEAEEEHRRQELLYDAQAKATEEARKVQESLFCVEEEKEHRRHFYTEDPDDFYSSDTLPWVVSRKEEEDFWESTF